jgi:RNA polymerase sigma factor (sigma-70 family)
MMKNDITTEFWEIPARNIYKYLIKIGCSPADAEDIVQDTLCKALEYLDGLDADTLTSWLFKVAINKYRDLCRKRNRREILNTDAEEFIDSLSSEPTGEIFVLNKERINMVKDILDSMSITNKYLLVMKYSMDLSYKQIGRLLGLSEKMVKTYLYRARNNFRKEWEAKEYGR